MNITEANAVSRVFRAIEAGDPYAPDDDLLFLAERAGSALRCTIRPPARPEEVLL